MPEFFCKHLARALKVLCHQKLSLQKRSYDNEKTKLKNKKIKKVVEACNIEIIFSRMLYLHSTHKIKINDLFPCQIVHILTALFKDTSERRCPTSKADLKNALKVEASLRNIIPEATLIDGCAMMYRILHWPKAGKVSDLFVTVTSDITNILRQSDVYLVFDRYNDQH